MFRTLAKLYSKLIVKIEKDNKKAPLDDYCYKYADGLCEHIKTGKCDPSTCKALNNKVS